MSCSKSYQIPCKESSILQCRQTRPPWEEVIRSLSSRRILQQQEPRLATDFPWIHILLRKDLLKRTQSLTGTCSWVKMECTSTMSQLSTICSCGILRRKLRDGLRNGSLAKMDEASQQLSPCSILDDSCASCAKRSSRVFKWTRTRPTLEMLPPQHHR